MFNFDIQDVAGHKIRMKEYLTVLVLTFLLFCWSWQWQRPPSARSNEYQQQPVRPKPARCFKLGVSVVYPFGFLYILYEPLWFLGK